MQGEWKDRRGSSKSQVFDIEILKVAPSVAMMPLVRQRKKMIETEIKRKKLGGQSVGRVIQVHNGVTASSYSGGERE